MSTVTVKASVEVNQFDAAGNQIGKAPVEVSIELPVPYISGEKKKTAGLAVPVEKMAELELQPLCEELAQIIAGTYYCELLIPLAIQTIRNHLGRGAAEVREIISSLATP